MSVKRSYLVTGIEIKPRSCDDEKFIVVLSDPEDETGTEKDSFIERVKKDIKNLAPDAVAKSSGTWTATQVRWFFEWLHAKQLR